MYLQLLNFLLVFDVFEVVVIEQNSLNKQRNAQTKQLVKYQLLIL